MSLVHTPIQHITRFSTLNETTFTFFLFYYESVFIFQMFKESHFLTLLGIFHQKTTASQLLVRVVKEISAAGKNSFMVQDFIT